MIIVRMFLAIFFISLTYSQTNDNIATFNFVEGDCLLKNDRIYNQFHSVLPGRNIYSGDIIKAKENSFCTIQFNDKKTYLSIDSNSSIQILDNELSREIKLENGSIYIKNVYNKTKKTYVFTSNNQIFIDNNNIWIETSYIRGDHFFSTANAIDIFNLKSSIQSKISAGILALYDNSDGYVESSNYSLIPDYVISEISNKNNKKNVIKLKKDDLIPIYGQRIYNTSLDEPYSLSFGLGTSIISDTAYLKFSINPFYKKDNFFIGVDLDGYINLDGHTINKDWDDIFDIIDRTYGHYNYNNNNNQMSLSFGKNINNVSFAQGYLLNDLGLQINLPTVRASGLYLKYKFDRDFMDLDILIPSFRDFANSGGVLGARTSLYISHKFPLTLGFGVVADLNQFSSISDQINRNINKKRNVIGVEFDFDYEIISKIDKEIHIFSEFVGIWYPDYIYYTFYDGENVSNDLKWRKGVWGIKGPGVSMKINNRYEIKFSFNINSATFIPNYFNSTYLYNRARYYKDDDLSYPLVQKQIDLIEDNFLVEGSTDEYLIPKDVYPVLFSNEGHSPYPVFGFTTEYSYAIYKYLSTHSKLSVFFEDSNADEQYYTLETSLKINDEFIRNLSYMNIYFSNTFFSKISDRQRMIFGIESEVKLPFRLALIINLAQVYYDSNLTNNNIDGTMNFGLDLNYNF